MIASDAPNSNHCSLAFCLVGDGILDLFSWILGQWKFLLVSIDYFTKWVEVEPLAYITEARGRDFVWNPLSADMVFLEL